MMAELQEVSWEVPYEGKPCYTAFCETEVLIIKQDDNLQVADAVPRRRCELTEDDKKQLERLNISPSSEFDDASIMAARCALDKRTTKVHIVRSNSGQPLCKSNVLQQIKCMMKTSTKPSLTIRYSGTGKINTGDWCFVDGFITFSDISGLYLEYFKGKILRVVSDCSYSGSWVKACMVFLDEQGVQPCAHSANKQEISVSVTASCRETEIPYQLLHSVRAYTNDKNTGVLGGYGNGWEVANHQHVKTASVASIRCNNKSIHEPCTLRPDYSWKAMSESDRVFLVRGKGQDRPAWHYVLLVDDEDTIDRFHEKVKMGSIDVAEYGEVLESGWGRDPPNETKDRIEKKYNIIYE